MPNSTIFGALGVPDNDYAFVNTYGQTVVYDATIAILGDHNDDMTATMALFVQADTKDHTMRYKLEGQGRLQETGRQSRAAEVKPGGGWDVGFPLKNYAAAGAMDRVTYAYMRLAEYNKTLKTVMNQDRNTARYNILRALFNNTARVVIDELWGSITVQPLANGDAVLYPPVVGSEVNATAQNYLGVPSSATTFNDSNNPIPLLVNALEQHFGTPTFGSEIIIFINNAQTASVQGLAGFDSVPNRFVTYGITTNLVDEVDIPPALPGRVLGEVDSALIVEWRWIPAGYMLAIHLGAEKPLMRRIDDPETGLEPGLQLVAESFDQPFVRAEWVNRYGVGAANRLNGVCLDLTAAGGANTYTVPTAYAN